MHKFCLPHEILRKCPLIIILPILSFFSIAFFLKFLDFFSRFGSLFFFVILVDLVSNC